MEAERLRFSEGAVSLNKRPLHRLPDGQLRHERPATATCPAIVGIFHGGKDGECGRATAHRACRMRRRDDVVVWTFLTTFFAFAHCFDMLAASGIFDIACTPGNRV